MLYLLARSRGAVQWIQSQGLDLHPIQAEAENHRIDKRNRGELTKRDTGTRRKKSRRSTG